MPNDKFDSKSFNPQAFKYMVGRVPNLHMHEIKKSKALAGNPDIKATLGGSQGGTGYARIAMRGLLDGDAVNYDGQTDITATSTKTFEQGVVAVGRAKAWLEKDFSYDITGGIDFMQNIADQVGLCAREYIDREVNSSLSGGELKRIEIATILARGTQLSIFDEPEAGIDLWSFNSLIKVFEKMRDEINGSILIISHQERILNIADKIIVIANGSVDSIGSKEEIMPRLMNQPSTCKTLTDKA